MLRLIYSAGGGVESVFTSKVTDYVASRPDYPTALFEMLKAACAPAEGTLIADVGAGTGCLTHGLLKTGYRVVAIEPNTEMRRAADHLLDGISGYSSVDGRAESMPLEAASAHLITAAQAFHWFEVERARTEFLRILTKQGQVVLIWNDRVSDDPLQMELDGVFGSFGGAKRAALVAHEDRSDVPSFFGATQPKEFSWPQVQYLDQAGLLSLVFSRSYIPGRDTREGPMIAERVREIFRRFAIKGMVEIRYRTVAILGRPT